MHSDLVPAIVYPDTHAARIDAARNDPEHEIVSGFCHLWKEDKFALPHPHNYRYRCANRTYEGDRMHSWCHRCMVGYITLTPEQTSFYKRRGNRMEAASV